MDQERTGLKAKLNRLRKAIKDKGLEKSGFNKFAGFSYYELKDFLPEVIDECEKIGIFTHFDIVNSSDFKYDETKQDYVQVSNGYEARLIAYDTDGTGKEEWSLPVPRIEGQNIMQSIGAANTYMKRYLYMNLLELSENDETDATLQKDEVKKPTPSEVTDFRNAYSEKERKSIREYYNVKKDEEIPQYAVKKYLHDRADIVRQARASQEALNFDEKREKFY